MRTEETKIYKFEELSEEAKDRALEDWCAFLFDSGFAWADEYFDSIKEGIKAFDCDLKDWSIDWLDENRSSVKVSAWETGEDEEERDLEAILTDDYKEKIFSEGGCPFTGFCGDEDFLDPIRDFLKKPDKETTMEELMRDCAYSVRVQAKISAKEQMTEEYFIDHAEVNNFEFTEDGKRW